MTELGAEECGGEMDTWRHHYVNSLTIVNGGEEETAAPISLIYGNYKEEPGVESPVMVGGAMEVKLANPVQESMVGAAHVEPPLFQGGVEDSKREPEDLTRKCVSPTERTVLCDKRRTAAVLLTTTNAVTAPSDSPPALIHSQNIKEEFVSIIKEEGGQTPRANHTIIIQAPLDSGDKMSTGGYLGTFQTATSQPGNYDVYFAQSPQPYTTSTSPAIRGSPSVYSPSAENYYREYYQVSAEPQCIRQEYPPAEITLDRYARPAPSYKTIVTVDSSPDSGISSDTLSTREITLSLPTQQTFYEEINQPTAILTSDLRSVQVSGSSPGAQRVPSADTPSTTPRPWHDFSRHTETDKIQIPKINSDDDKICIEKLDNTYGFKYYLESPISTSPRREDDRITYINKGQFYPITLEYVPDPERSLKPGTVKSVVMLMFREEKSAEDERKAWYFWHGRQHSVKQRILDVDTKNSVGLLGSIDEISHNAIAVYWNPLESSAKISVAVQCLSTDFSSQKGVKGLPLHIQIDTYEDPRDNGLPVTHRGYCQLKVFCDKGAERKTRDEERRANKRRMNPTNRKKYEDLYHSPCERSEFYTMADTLKEPVLFRPSEDVEKVSYMNMEGSFYNDESENGVCGVSLGGANMDAASPTLMSPSQGHQIHIPISAVNPPSPLPPQVPCTSTSVLQTSSPPLSLQPPPPLSLSCSSSSQNNTTLTTLVPLQPPVSPKSNNLRAHYNLSQPYGEFHKDITGNSLSNGCAAPPMDDMFTHSSKRTRLCRCSINDRIMILVKREGDDSYTMLHLVPPTTLGLLNAIEQKFQIPRSSIRNIFRINKAGVRAILDDEGLKYYCDEDCFIIKIQQREDETFDITLIQVDMHDQ